MRQRSAALHALCAGLALAMWTMPGLAQSRPPARSPAPAVGAPAPSPNPATPAAPAPDTIPDSPAPYEPQLLRLSEILGALSVLSPLCNAGDPSIWRSQMDRLIDAEAQTSARRERLAGAYNRGFSGLSRTYRTCTRSALALIDRYREEGGKLARDITTRFGGG